MNELSLILKEHPGWMFEAWYDEHNRQLHMQLLSPATRKRDACDLMIHKKIPRREVHLVVDRILQRMEQQLIDLEKKHA